jgi:ABC-2 type transport system ATP-binding protein
MIINLENVNKNIAGIPVLKNISYKFEGGKIYGLKGKNGCGKTMLMRSIAGLMKPSNGKIFINDKCLYKDMDVPESIGILIENPSFLTEYSGLENLKMLSCADRNIKKEDLSELLKSVGLNPDDKKKVRKYSLGMKQRLGIAAALMGNPEIVLLDEPINAIDEAGVSEIRDLIRSKKSEERIIILACHDNEELEYLADEIVYMSDGEIKMH